MQIVLDDDDHLLTYGGLFQICARLTGDHFVDKLSAMGQQTRPTQPSIPPGLVNE